MFVEDAERKADITMKLRNFQTDNDLQRKLNAAWSKDKGIKFKRIPTQPNQIAAIPTKNYASESKAYAHDTDISQREKDDFSNKDFNKLNSSL